MRYWHGSECERPDFEYLDQEPFDCAGLLTVVPLHRQVEVAVVCDRVAVGVEQGCVPVAESLVPLGAVERQSDVAPGEVQFGVIAGHDHHRCLGVGAMVARTGFGHVDDGRIIEHRAITLGNGLELADQGFDLFHVMGLDGISHVRSTGNLPAMADLVNARLLVVLGQ